MRRMPADQEQCLCTDIVNNIQTGVMVLKVESSEPTAFSRIVHVNPAAARMMGSSPEKLLGRKLEECPGLLGPELLKHITEVSRSGEPGYLGEASCRISPCVCSLQGFPLLGRCVGIAIENVTGHKRTEDELRRSAAYLMAGERLSHIGSWAVNLLTGELFWSPEIYRIFGFDPATTKPSLDDTFLQRIHPEDRPRVEKSLREAARQKNSHVVNYRVVLPDGSLRHIQDLVYPVENESGQVVERYGVAADVTERVQAEEELTHSRAELRALAAHTRSAQEEERARISRAIHDELGEVLTGLKFEISSIAGKLRRDQQALRKRARDAIRLVDSSLVRVRRIAAGLRPELLDALGLKAAIAWQVEDFQSRTGISCSRVLPPEKLTLEKEQEIALFRILQESLTNIGRHASAQHVQVSLFQAGGALVLEVKDDGRGSVPQDRRRAGSLGIVGMRERAWALGGAMEITSRPGSGTTVRVRLPLNLSSAMGAST